MNNHLCVIDIGSTLTHVIVGRPVHTDLIEILGVGTSASQGIRNGAIINIDAIIRSVSDAAREAELMSGLVIDNALVNITGKHIHGDNSRGVVAIPNKDRQITKSDVLRVIEGAQNIRIPNDQEIVHVLSRQFVVDDQHGIKDPVGMTGIRLEADVHIVTAGLTALTNLDKTINGAGIKLSGGVMSSLASAESVLMESDKELGVAVIDIGGGIVDIIIYLEGGVCFSSTISLGGIHVTQDLSIGLKISAETAETLKKQYGHAMMKMVDPVEKIDLPQSASKSPRLVLKQHVAEIIEARMTEIFELVDHELVKSGKKNSLAGGVILVGGACLLPGSEELASECLGLAAELRFPSGIEGFSERVNTSEYATATGMLHYTNRLMSSNEYTPGANDNNGIYEKFKNWFKENL